MNDEQIGAKTPQERGAEIIRAFAATLPNMPGVYRMLGAGGDLLYVGKARALKKRVLSYTQTARLSQRIQRMVAETADMMFVTVSLTASPEAKGPKYSPVRLRAPRCLTSCG